MAYAKHVSVRYCQGLTLGIPHIERFNGFDLDTNPVFTCTKPLDKTAFDTLRLSTIQPSLAADMVELMIFTLLLCSKKPESSKDASGQADAQEPS
jgi:hypothetical protein